MILKKSFLIDSKENLKRRNGIFLSIFLLFFSFYPGFLMIGLHRLKQQEGYYTTKEEFLKRIDDLLYTVFDINVFTIFAVAIMAVVIGIHGFQYLYDKKQVNFYHSQPVKRSRRFLVLWWNGIFIFLLSYAVNVTAGLVVSGIYVEEIGKFVKVSLQSFGIHLLFFLSIYHITLISVMLTGHVLVSLLASAVFLSYEIALRGGIYLYHSYFHYTFDGKNSERITDVLFSPMVMIFNYIYKSRKNVPMAFMETGTGEQEKILLWLAFLTVIFGILSFILYLRRASESYGKSISFSFVKEPVKAAILFLAGIYGGLFFYSASGSAVAFGVVGIIFIILLGHAVIQMIYEADLKAVRKKLLLPFGVIAVTVTFFIVYKYDLTEYDMRYPKESKVEAVGIDLMTENRYDQFWLLEDGIELWNNEYAQNMMRITNLQPVYQLLSNMENLKEIKKNNEANKNNGVEEGNYYHVDIKFYLKNNKVEYRRYYFDYVKNIELLNEIYHMEEYKKVTEQILEEDFIEKNNIFQAVYGNGLKETPLEKKEKISKLLEAYKKDMEEVHYRNIFSEMPVGSIRFEGRGILSEEFTNYWQKPVYPSFKNTISFFEGEGIHWKAGQDVEEILESVADVTVAVTDYDKWRMASYVNKDKYTKEIVYKEKEKIKEILEIGIPRLCRDWTNAPVEIEEQYTIEVRRKITPEEKRIITGEPDYVTGDIDYLEEIIIYSYIFKKGEVPEFIEKDFS